MRSSNAAAPPRTTNNFLLLLGGTRAAVNCGGIGLVSKLPLLTVVGVSLNAVVGLSLPGQPGGRNSASGLPQFRQKLISSESSWRHAAHFFITGISQTRIYA